MRIGAGSASRPSRILVRSIAKRMETIDDETAAAAIDYMGRQVKADKPFFVWMNATRMHVFTHFALRCADKVACLATNMPTA